MYVGVPVSILFMSLIVLAQIGLQWVNWEIAVGDADTTEEKDKAKVPNYWKYVPGVINSILIIVFGMIYAKLSAYLLREENHRYTSDFENSSINKSYMFAFVNVYIGNFVAIFYNQNFSALSLNLAIVMVFKQLFINTLEFFTEKISVSKKLKKVDELFEEQIGMAELA